MRSIVGAALLVVVGGCAVEHGRPRPSAPVSTAPTATATEMGSATSATSAMPSATKSNDAATGVVGWSNFTGDTARDTCTKESETELCWDAVDNNCNGQLDEGCAYGGADSPLHFVVAWRAKVDLDLHVIAPDGNEVSFGVRAAGSLVLDKDCRGNGDCGSNNVENVFVPAGQSPLKGHYKVYVRNGNAAGEKEPSIPFLFGASVGGKVFFVPTTVANKTGARKEFEFDVN